VCSLCCKLLSIEHAATGGPTDFPFNKPAGEWCKHFTPGRGCAVFNSPELPNLCRNYLCLWKHAGEDPALPEDCRPDKIHAIIQPDMHSDFPDQIVLRVILTRRGIGLKLSRVLKALKREVSLLMVGGGIKPGIISSDNLELTKALAVREKEERT
jgi:hypothetical protein